MMLFVLPTLPFAAWKNAKITKTARVDNFDQLTAKWSGDLDEDHRERRDVVAILYQGELARVASLENKAIGLLTASSIVAAGAFASLFSPTAPVAAVVALIYLSSSGVAACWLLTPRMRKALFLRDVKSKTSGFAEMAATTESLGPVATWTSNLVTAAARDLTRGLLATVVAVALVISAHSG